MFNANVLVEINDGKFDEARFNYYYKLGLNFDERGQYPGRQDRPDSPMTWTTKCAKVDALRLLLSKGINPNARPDTTPPEPFPVWYAALLAAYTLSPENSRYISEYKTHCQQLQLLIDAKANLDLFTYWGSFSMCLGVPCTDPKDSQCKDVLTTLMALIKHYPNLEVIEMLLKGGASLTVKDAEGKTAVDYAAETKNDILIKLINGYVRPTGPATPLPPIVPPTIVPPTVVPPTVRPTFRDLYNEMVAGTLSQGRLDYYTGVGVNINEHIAPPPSGGFEGWTPLTYAINEGKADMVELLLHNGADPHLANLPEKSLWFPLFLAAHLAALDRTELPPDVSDTFNPRIKILQLLLDCGVNVKQVTVELQNPHVPRTALMHLVTATGTPNLHIIEKLLIYNKAAVDYKAYGSDILDWAKAYHPNNQPLIDLLKKYQSGSNPTGEPTPGPGQSIVTTAEEKRALDALHFYVDNGPPEHVGYYVRKDLQPYAKQAARLKQYLMPFLNDTDLVLAAGILALYDLVVLVSDSPSMKDDDNEDRVKTLTTILHGLAKIYSRVGGHAEGGIRAIRWFNNKATVDNISSELTIDDFVGKNTFGGGASKIGTFLNNKILDEFFRKQNQNGAGRPLLVLITTDKDVNAEHRDLLENTITQSISKLQGEDWMGAASIAYQFIQIGNNAGATKLFKKLSTRFSKSPYVRTQPEQMKLGDAVAAGEKETILMLVKLLVAPFTDLWDEI